ncbi:MAG TPA: lysophospholipid acyltransferase family protein [Rickettsiales bacterium]|nr:lysophospholipid acyltransferase family protein [Rickettsiales bacterium]
MKKKTNFSDFIYKSQAFGLKVLEKIFILIGLKWSSFLIGLLLVIFGPWTPPSFLAMRNLKKVMPELTLFQRIKIILGMWNNLGKGIAEFILINSISYEELEKYINIDKESEENLKKIKNSKQGELIFTAHFGNWEIFSRIFAHLNIPISAIYRAMNNKYVDDIILEYRQKNKMEMIPKGQKGVIKLARSLRSGRKILMLVDQRLSNGIDVKFLDRDAKTTDSVATLALRHNYKVYSAVVFRRSFSSFFDVKIEEFDVINTGNLKEDIEATTLKINKKIESWIRLKPEQWFWVHNRWKK